MKFLYPGSQEFDLSDYWDLPYTYVLDAIQRGLKEERRRLHYYEAPIALQTSLLANINRDTKKQKRAYMLDDFFFYQDNEDRNTPAGLYGAAALALIEKKLFPSWALFTYRDLKDGADGNPPAMLALIGDDCMILAPKITPNGIHGMLIAMESASSELRAIKSPCGETALVVIPEFKGKYYCEENSVVRKII